MTLTPLRPDDPAVLGSYRLTARLGTGGMGVVYLGADGAGRPAAIKMVREDCAADPVFRSRFRHEIEAVQAIESRWTARLLGADADADRPWLATEYVPGPNLGEAATGGTPLPPDRVRAIAADLAAALQAIHAAGVVHRDLKPGNVVLGADGLKVIDFGIAAAAAQTVVTRTGVVLGSLGYTAPEQLTGASPVTAAADVFSWGITVVFAATGRCPFGRGSPEALLFRVVYEPPDLTGVPVDLLAAVSDAVQKNPELRPTASQLARRTTVAPCAAAAHDVTDYDQNSYAMPPTVSGRWRVPASWLRPAAGRSRRQARSLAGVALVAAIAAFAAGGGLLAAGGHPDRQETVAGPHPDAATARSEPLGVEPLNTGPSRTGPSRTGPSSTGSSNTGSSNTGSSNTGSQRGSPPDGRQPDPSPPEVAWMSSDAAPPGTVDPTRTPGHPSAGAAVPTARRRTHRRAGGPRAVGSLLWSRGRRSRRQNVGRPPGSACPMRTPSNAAPRFSSAGNR